MITSILMSSSPRAQPWAVSREGAPGPVAAMEGKAPSTPAGHHGTAVGPREAGLAPHVRSTQAVAGPLNAGSSHWALLKLTSFMN